MVIRGRGERTQAVLFERYDEFAPQQKIPTAVYSTVQIISAREKAGFAHYIHCSCKVINARSTTVFGIVQVIRIGW